MISVLAIVLLSLHHSSVTLPQNSTSLLCFELSDLDLPSPVFVVSLLLHPLVLLLDEHEWVWHSFHLTLQGRLLLLHILGLVDCNLSVLDVLLFLNQTRLLGLHLSADVISSLLGSIQIELQLVQSVLHIGRTVLELEQFVISVLNVLNMFLVLYLHLMEIDKLQVVTHLILRLNVALCSQNGHLQGHIFGSQLVNVCLLLQDFVIHIL